MSAFKKYGISTYKNIQVWDNQQEDYARTLFNAAIELDNLVNTQKQHVFVHCFTGISRTPTLIVLYWALFLRHEYWSDINELENDIIANYELANPNMEMVDYIVQHNAAFQAQQKQRQQDEDEARRLAIMKLDRINQLKNMKEEYERLKRKRLAEAEAEKNRIQRANAANEEMVRKQLQELEDLERERRRKEREIELLTKANKERDDDADR